MSLAIDVKSDIKSLIKKLNKFERQVIPLATVSALNKTATQARTAVVREIAKEKGVQVKLIRGRVRLFRANRRNQVALLKINAHGFRAVDLGVPRQTKTGTRVKKHNFPGAFIATMPRGHTGVFKRKGRSRLPITEKRISLLPEAHEIANRNVNRLVKQKFPIIFVHEVNFRLRKLNAR